MPLGPAWKQSTRCRFGALTGVKAVPAIGRDAVRLCTVTRLESDAVTDVLGMRRHFEPSSLGSQ
jgi:hypothetical protein